MVGEAESIDDFVAINWIQLYTSTKSPYNIGNTYGKDGERMGDYMPTDKQYDGQLIEEYSRLKRIREVAVKENALDTVKVIDIEINYIKLKLKPLELPDDEAVFAK